MGISGLKAQQKSYNFSANFQKGIIVPHYKSMKYITKGYTNSFDLKYGIKIEEFKNSKNKLKYSAAGIAYNYTNLGNPDILGNANSIYGFFNSSLIRNKKISLNYDFAFGVAYFNKPFSPENTMNFVIGSHFNAYLHFFTVLNYRLNIDFET